MMDERLKKQLDFSLEIDKEKNVFRHSLEIDKEKNVFRHAINQYPVVAVIITVHMVAIGLGRDDRSLRTSVVK